jgi:RNA polymerase sigma-70 factor (ECF subfamily)
VSPSAPHLRVIPGGSVREPTESELVRAFSAGDPAALTQLIRRHQDTVFRVVRRYAKSVDDARDLTQRAFLQALEAAQRALPRLASSDQEVPFKAWLLRIAVNLGKNHARDAGRWLLTSLDAVDVERPALAATHAALERAEEVALTRAAVLALPPRQREVFTLRIDAGLPFAEVATTLGITEGNAKAHFHHAVKRLKEEVARLSTPGVRNEL